MSNNIATSRSLAALETRERERLSALMKAGAVFVFGSNTYGRHGKGAALYALKHCGAIYGKGIGRMGRCYAIPTKEPQHPKLPGTLRTLALDRIGRFVSDFLLHASRHPEETFAVTRIGCGLAGFRDEQIAILFSGAPSNCELPEGWRR